MLKVTQTIRREKPTNCVNVFDHFVELAVQGLRGRLVGKSVSRSLTSPTKGNLHCAKNEVFHYRFLQ